MTHSNALLRRERGAINVPTALVVALLSLPLLTAVAGVTHSLSQGRSAAPAPTVVAAAPAGTATPAAKPTADIVAAGFTPPDAHAIPDTEMGKWIARGEAIFMRTPEFAKGYTGNSLNCVNCHLDAGRLKDSAPLWGAYPLYPAYRAKTKNVSTFSERLRGCFMYSMNGKAPNDGDDILVALESYAYWMAKGAPTGETLPGAGFAKIAAPERKPSFDAGSKVYGAKCALCHGTDGQGQKVSGVTVFPALWGRDSYNWGAGMHEIDKAARFIKANMPYGLHNTLTEQEAWDVATYINSFERPQDPRFSGSIDKTRQQFHDTPYSLYGVEVNGKVLGRGL